MFQENDESLSQLNHSLLSDKEKVIQTPHPGSTKCLRKTDFKETILSEN